MVFILLQESFYMQNHTTYYSYIIVTHQYPVGIVIAYCMYTARCDVINVGLQGGV